MYNWQQPNWPNFTYTLSDVESALDSFIEKTGLISGSLKGLTDTLQLETIINIMVAEAIKTSAIEGETLSRPDVASSIRNNLGLTTSLAKIKDKKAQAAGELMVLVRNTFAEPLTEKMLYEWHALLMSQSKGITIGGWRSHTEPMQIVSGAFGKEKVHFEAPPSAKVPAEMKRFIKWFNDTAPSGNHEIKKAPVRSAIAHLYFESIHPFEDGNGRIGRAIAEKALSQTIGRPVVLSLSQTIEANRKQYYQALEKAQRSNDITAWVTYFVNVVVDAQQQATTLIDFTLKKTKFFDTFKDKLNSRQLKVITKMLAEGAQSFKGGMTPKKYVAITKTSIPTASRDLRELTQLGILASQGAGPSTSYVFVGF